MYIFDFVFVFVDNHMYQPERVRINIPETVPTYAYVGPSHSSTSYRYPYETSVSYCCPNETRVSYRYPCESIVSYQYPCESRVSYQYPCEVIVKREDRNDGSLCETKAIRRDLTQIKKDINDLKRRQTSPTYYVLKEDYPPVGCPICNSPTYNKQQKQYSEVPMYYCEKCQGFVEQRAYTLGPTIRSKTPNTTYQDSYRRPPPSAFDHLDRRITLNELQTQGPPSTAPAQHPRHWVPAATKNTYPHRRWNLSVPHSEP